jgi:hypothetical protein
MLSNCLLKHVVEGKKVGKGDEERDVNTYWMTLRKRGNTGNLKRKH